MKKILVILLVLLGSVQQSFAKVIDDEKGFTIGVGFGDWKQDYTYFHVNHFIWSIRAGYRFKPEIEAGAFLRFDNEDGSCETRWLGVYGEYGFKLAKSFRIFIDGDISLICPTLYYDSYGCGGGSVLEYWEIGFRPGIAYKLRRLPIELKLRYLFIGFNNLHFDRTGACLGKNKDWIIDAGLNRLEIGAAVTF